MVSRKKSCASSPSACAPRLLRVPNVAKVELFGVQAEKLFIEIPQLRLAQLGVDLGQVLTQLNAQNAVEGAGVYAGDRNNIQLRVNGAIQTVEQLRSLPIRVIRSGHPAGPHPQAGRHRHHPSWL